jgi:hypothetical protein
VTTGAIPTVTDTARAVVVPDDASRNWSSQSHDQRPLPGNVGHPHKPVTLVGSRGEAPHDQVGEQSAAPGEGEPAGRPGEQAFGDQLGGP